MPVKVATDIFHLSLDGGRNKYYCEVCKDSIPIYTRDDLAVFRATSPTKANTIRNKEIREFQDYHLIKHGLKQPPKSKQRGRYT